MKTLFFIIIIILFASLVIPTLQDAMAIPYLSPQDLYKQSDMVFHGQVISKQTGPGPDYYYYQIKVDTYFKNPQTSDSITIAGHKPDNNTRMTYPQFGMGDKAIFYINKLDGINTISPYSQIAGDACDVRSFTELDTLPSPPTLGAAASTTIYIEDVNENMPYIPLTNHTAILRDDNVWNNSPESRTVPVTLTIDNEDTGKQVFNQTQNLEMQACSGPETVKWNFVPTQIANYAASVSGNKNELSMTFQAIFDSTKSLILSPLKQFQSGVAAQDVKCKQGLQLVIKSEDNSPACVKSQTAQRLVERGWGWAMQPIDSLKQLFPNRITGLENDTGIVTFGNRTYYFETPHYTQDAYVNPVHISFHGVVFTLFPSGFKGGLPDNDCGSQYYWTDAKFSDGISELLHIFPITSTSQQCLTFPEPTYFSNHTNPQAGLTFYDGKLKLLASVEGELQQNNSVFSTPLPTNETIYHDFPHPPGYPIINSTQGIIVNNDAEASNLTGFSVKSPTDLPQGYKVKLIKASKEIPIVTIFVSKYPLTDNATSEDFLWNQQGILITYDKTNPFELEYFKQLFPANKIITINGTPAVVSDISKEYYNGYAYDMWASLTAIQDNNTSIAIRGFFNSDDLIKIATSMLEK